MKKSITGILNINGQQEPLVFNIDNYIFEGTSCNRFIEISCDYGSPTYKIGAKLNAGVGDFNTLGNSELPPLIEKVRPLVAQECKRIATDRGWDIIPASTSPKKDRYNHRIVAIIPQQK